MPWTTGVQVNPTIDSHKRTRMSVTTPVAKRASDSYDLLQEVSIDLWVT